VSIFFRATGVPQTMMQIEETLEPGLRFTYEVEEVLHTRKSQFQTVALVRTKSFGNALVIDGLMQSADVDERVYHESLVHPAMLLHECPRTVFIGGAGEGSTAREVLKHNTVEKCVMVDIDGVVVDFCKEVFPQNAAAFRDPRLELVIEDAMVRLATSPISFDVIILDLDDPLEGGPCYQLYTREFYTLCREKLNPGGILISQCSSAGVKCHKMVFSPVHHTLEQVFPTVLGYCQHVYCFADTWGFNLASMDPTLKLPSAEEVDRRIAARGLGDLFFLDGISLNAIFLLPKFLRVSLTRETTILTKGTYAHYISGVDTIADENKKEANAG